MFLYNNVYTVDILVNGNSCKQYHHNEKIFIEAKDGSEYEIKINNNSYMRVLAVTSVDGLNVLTGEMASELDSGYVINNRDVLRIKGFRCSDDKVGAFKFCSKNSSYAKETGNGNNVGVIGVKIFAEQVRYSKYVNGNLTYGPDIYRTYTSDSSPISTFSMNMPKSTTKDVYLGYCSSLKSSNARGLEATPCANFDMGTQWGQAIESKVVDVEFERGLEVLNLNIYYASRQSLIDMGVPIKNEVKISYPESFPKKYATPPKNWK